MVTRHVLPCLWTNGLVIAECFDLGGVEAGEGPSVWSDHYRGLRVSEGLDSFACVLVGADVVDDVRDAVLHEFPLNGFTGLASGLSKQLGDGLVGVHGVLSGMSEARNLSCWLRALCLFSG